MTHPLPNSSHDFWVTCFVLVVLSCLTFATFIPILEYEFVDLDVDAQVVKNPYIRGLSAQNVKDIFTSRSMTSYYPIRTLSFAVDYRFWGMEPRGFKLTNILCHLFNVLLVFWLLCRLLRYPIQDGVRQGTRSDVWLAGLSAGVFAVHPVVVEPVTWVAGREELLMTLGALGAVHFHLSARQMEVAGNTRGASIFRAATLFCCAGACLSNAVAAVIPLIITAWDLLTLSPPRFRKILRNTWMLWMIGVATIAIKKLGPDGDPIAGQAAAISAERLMLVVSVYGLNLKTLLWPSELAVVYTRISPHSFFATPVLGGLLAVGLSCAILWTFRRRKLLLFGLVWFGVALIPSSQIMVHHWIRADRFLYLPLVGLVLALGLGLSSVINGLKHRWGTREKQLPCTYLQSSRRSVMATMDTPKLFFPRSWAAVGVMTCVVLCVILLYRVSTFQIATWRSSLSLWEHCVSVSPGSPVARGGLADNLVNAGRFSQAIPHYRMALRFAPDSRETLNNFALELAANEDTGLRDYRLAIELAKRGCKNTGWQDRKLRHTLATAYNNFALDLESRSEYRQALLSYAKAIEADDHFEEPLFNLALLLATCSDPSLRRARDAIEYAERACQIVGRSDPNGLWILAMAYAEAKELRKAIATIEEALALAQANGATQFADTLRKQLEMFRNQLSSREYEK